MNTVKFLKNTAIATPNGIPAFTVEEAMEAYNSLKSDIIAVKAQIHAGGRGKGGVLKLPKTKMRLKNILKTFSG